MTDTLHDWLRPLYFVDVFKVNMDNLLMNVQGGIVRVDGNPRNAVRVVYPAEENYDFVAGMVSDYA